MKALSGLFAISILLTVLSACSASEDSNPKTTNADAVEAVKATMAKYVSGYESKDVETCVEVFTEDAIRMPPNGPAIFGSDGIRSYYQEWFESESLDVVVLPKEIEVAGNWAFAWGTYSAVVTTTSSGDQREDEGKWINVFKKGADGIWRFHRNIWNSDKPLPVNDVE